MANYIIGQASIQEYVDALVAAGAVVDFVAYHPYTGLFGDWNFVGDEIVGTTPAEAADFGEEDVAELRRILSALYPFHETLAISTTLSSPAGVELGN
jgi:hypothetical protein